MGNAQLWRIIKVSNGQWQNIDQVIAQVQVNQMQTIRQIETNMTPIPGDYHLVIPMGSDTRQFNIGFWWNEYTQCAAYNNIAATCNFGTTLKQWDCSPLYYVQLRQTSMMADVWPLEQYAVCKQLQLERTIPEGVFGADTISQAGLARPYKRWAVTMNLMTAPTPSMEAAPAFDFTRQWELPHMRTDGVIGLKLTNISDGTTMDRPLRRIVVKYQTDVKSYPVTNQLPPTILPTLGTVGPVIDIEFIMNNDAQYAQIMRWATGYGLTLGSTGYDTVVKVEATAYEEFDDDDPTGIYTAPRILYDPYAKEYYQAYKHSKWIVTGLQVTRQPGDGGAFNPQTATGVDLQPNQRWIKMTLTRYWKWELMNNG